MALISSIYHIKDKPRRTPKKKPFDIPSNPEQPVADAMGTPAERAFVRRAKARGWHVLRSGWPDYMLTRKTATGIEFQCVEVKQDHIDDALRQSQELMLASLVMQGLNVSVWSAETKTLRRITAESAKDTIERFYMSIEQQKVKQGLRELKDLGVLVRYDA